MENTRYERAEQYQVTGTEMRRERLRFKPPDEKEVRR